MKQIRRRRRRNVQRGGVEPLPSISRDDFKVTTDENRINWIGTLYKFASYLLSILKSIPFHTFRFVHPNVKNIEAYQNTEFSFHREHPYFLFGGIATEIFKRAYPQVSCDVDPTADIDVEFVFAQYRWDDIYKIYDKSFLIEQLRAFLEREGFIDKLLIYLKDYNPTFEVLADRFQINCVVDGVSDHLMEMLFNFDSKEYLRKYGIPMRVLDFQIQNVYSEVGALIDAIRKLGKEMRRLQREIETEAGDDLEELRSLLIKDRNKTDVRKARLRYLIRVTLYLISTNSADGSTGLLINFEDRFIDRFFDDIYDKPEYIRWYEDAFRETPEIVDEAFLRIAFDYAHENTKRLKTGP